MKKCIFLLKEVGLSIRKVMRLMELDRHSKHGQLPFFQRDIHNIYVKMRRKSAKNDAIDLLQFCKVAKEDNSRFQYAFTIDEENKLEHNFGHLLIVLIGTKNMKMWFILYFFTIYKVNAYNMPFGIFVSVNNYEKTILFSCALLQNEITSVFRWLMKVHSLSYKFLQLFFLKFYLINW